MSSCSGGPLLAADDPHPFCVHNRDGRAPFLLVGDHAGNAIPRALGTLGLNEADRVRHIAWDIGTAALGRALSRMLDAPFVEQAYSRLVIDCNRAPDCAEAIRAESDGSVVPGNAGLGRAEAAARIAAIHEPYQEAIADLIAARRAAGRETILVSLHSFTPAMAGVARPWHAGILHDDDDGGGDSEGGGGAGDPRFALALLAALRAPGELLVGDNEPYRMDGTDHTVPRHAFADGLPYAEIEIRQDGLGDEAGIAAWAERLARALPAARRAQSRGAIAD